MENAVKRRLQTVQFGEARTYKNLTILPLISEADGAFQYCTLGEAIASWEVAITEVSLAGAAGELKVVSRGSRSVLLLCGEELAGAKRNRVLNATVLLKELSEARIPVTGAERARWSYTSKVFSASGNLMACRGRSQMTRSVQCSLERSGAFHSNPREVGDALARLQAKACASSPTSTLSDVFRAREDELRLYDEAVKPLPDQVGLLAIIDGTCAGIDVVSLKSAYTHLHTKLARSYALEALLTGQPAPVRGPEGCQQPGQRRWDNGNFRSVAAPFSPGSCPLTLAKAFLEEVIATAARPFPSIGHGTDLRYQQAAPKAHAGGSPTQPSAFSLQPSLIGSALVHQDEVIHAAFFPLNGTD